MHEYWPALKNEKEKGGKENTKRAWLSIMELRDNQNTQPGEK